MTLNSAIIRTVFDIEKPFDDIRLMNKYELKSYIKRNRSIQVKIMSRNYSESDRMVSSKVIYAKNRLRLM
jgi:hypothetical protein